MRRFKKLQAIFFTILNAFISVIKLSRIHVLYPKITRLQNMEVDFVFLFQCFFLFFFCLLPTYTICKKNSEIFAVFLALE